ncbi:MAG TPA: hypothetical protein VKP64_12440 [Mycobacteriales bacterium]|nr:hypothetical protein [Mycobacteriales bacterium]
MPAGVEVPDGERVVEWAPTPDGAAVATETALLLPGGVRLPWAEVDQVRWRRPVLVVDVPGRPPVRVRLSEPRRLPEAVRERVQASIVVSAYHRLGRGGGVRVVARRAGSGEPVWSLVYDGGADASDPATRAEAHGILGDVRAQTGL